MNIDETRIDPVPLPEPGRNPNRRWAAIAVVLLVLAAAITTSRLASTDRSGGAAGPLTPTTLDAALGGDDRDAPATVEDVTVDVAVPESGESGGGLPSEGMPLDEGGALPADPCDALEGDRSLIVGPDTLVLAPTAMASHLTIRNCSGAAVDWTAQTAPEVALQMPAGALAGGAEVDLQFAVDEDAIGPGAFDFTITVSEPGGDTDVDVHVFKGILNDAIPQVPGIGFTAGGSAGGCSLQCITKAWLTPLGNTADVSLEIETTVPARLRVWVSTGLPVLNGTTPYFPGVSPVADSGGIVDGWTTPVAPLQPATTYNIIVRATDGNGKAAFRVGSFTSPTPVQHPGGLAPTQDVTGCAVQCIDGATLLPIEGSSDVRLDVSTTEPAAIEVFVSDEAPIDHPNGYPYFAGGDLAVASTGGSLETGLVADLTDLDGDTDYHVIVNASDGEHRRSYRVGTFHTEQHLQTVVVAFHRIHVDFDGDGGANRGELEFALGVDGESVATLEERKIGSNTTLNLSDGNIVPGINHVVEGVGDMLPALAVQGFERDWDAHGEYCTGTGLMRAALYGFTDSCDHMWNTAATGFNLTDDLDAMASCPSLGVDGLGATARCQEIETVDHGAGYPRFRAVVSFAIVE